MISAVERETVDNLGYVPIYCQCDRCLDLFTAYGKFNRKGRLTRLEKHPKIKAGQGIRLQHICGGNLTFIF